MNTRQRKILVWTIVVGSLALYYEFLLDPALAAGEQATMRLQGVQRDVRQLRKEKQQIESIQNMLKRVRRDLSTRAGEDVVGSLIKTLDSKELKGLETENFATQPDVKARTTFPRTRISFDARGDLGQIYRMIYTLTFWDEYYRIESLSIRQNRGRLSVKIPLSSTLITENPVNVGEEDVIDLFDQVPGMKEYEALGKNMFWPYIPPPPPKKPSVKPERPTGGRKPRPKPRRSRDVYLAGIQSDGSGGYQALVQDSRDSRKFDFVRPGQKYLIYEVKKITRDEVHMLSSKGEPVKLTFGQKAKLFTE